ncbi:MAG: TonB-dependent siderophore receptor [Prosthecobacter sp.]
MTVTSLLCAAGGLAAQTADNKPADVESGEKPDTNLKEIIVEAPANVYNPQKLINPKYSEPLREVPQTVTVIPKAVIQDRGAFSLRDVLRNTPGISMQAGEGVSGAGAGDNLAIRGFSSRSDWFIDGMRDFGTYNRDPFNTEQVEVAKGPASTIYGRGSTGGSINLATKMAGLDPYNLSTFSVGTSNLYRGTVDVNERLGEHSALRLNGMYHHSDTPGRNDVFQERYGIAASLAFGLGTDTRFTLNYQRVEENNLPDFGIPWTPTNGTFAGSGAGLQSYGNQPPPVSYDSFYGRRNYDFQRTQGDMITAIFEHDFSKSLRIRNVMRYSRMHSDARITAPRFRDTAAAGGNQYTSILVREEQRRRMTNEYFANQTMLMADFETGPLKHALVTGLEFYWERQLTATRAGNTTTTDLFNPGTTAGLVGPVNVNRDTTVFGVSPTDLTGSAEAHLDTISIFIFDTIEIGRHWELSAGVRYDHLDAEQRGIYPTGRNDIFGGGNAGPSNSDDLFSWKAALIFKPVDYGSIYFGYGTSFNPTVDGAVTGGLGVASFGPAGASAQGLNAEQSNSYELGTKWDLLKERLSLTAALFRTEKINARTTNAGVTSLAGDQVVEGIELGIAGQLTKNWQIFAGATHMTSKVKMSSNPAEIGRPLANAPDYTFNLWTTYNVLEDLQVGFGAQYMGNVIGNSTNPTRVVPDYWTMDAMVSYRFSENFSLRLNLYNLADNRYIETSSSTGHFIPGPGRSLAVTASVKF